MRNKTAAVLTRVPKSSVGGSMATASPKTTASSLWLSFSIFSFASLRIFSYFSFPEERRDPQMEAWEQCQSHSSWEAPLPPCWPLPETHSSSNVWKRGCCFSLCESWCSLPPNAMQIQPCQNPCQPPLEPSQAFLSSHHLSRPPTDSLARSLGWFPGQSPHRLLKTQETTGGLSVGLTALKPPGLVEVSVSCRMGR